MMSELADVGAALAIDDAGGPLVRVAFGLTLFVPEIWRPERRAAAAAVISEYAKEANGQLKNWRHPRTERWVPQLPVDPTAWLADRSVVEEWSWEACGATPEIADPWAITVLGVPNWQSHCGFVRASWPAAFATTPDRCTELFGRWADALHAEDGYAGFLLVAPPELDRRATAEPYIRRLAEAHVGLLVDAPIAFALHGTAHVKTMGWLTFVSAQFDTAEPRPPASTVRCQSGRIYCQGPAPDLGGAMGALPPPRGAHAVAVALEGVRLKSIPGLQMAGPGRFDETAATQWLRRFN